MHILQQILANSLIVRVYLTHDLEFNLGRENPLQIAH